MQLAKRQGRRGDLMDLEGGKTPSIAADALIGDEMDDMAAAHQRLRQRLRRKQMPSGTAGGEDHELVLSRRPVERHHRISGRKKTPARIRDLNRRSPPRER